MNLLTSIRVSMTCILIATVIASAVLGACDNKCRERSGFVEETNGKMTAQFLFQTADCLNCVDPQGSCENYDGGTGTCKMTSIAQYQYIPKSIQYVCASQNKTGKAFYEASAPRPDDFTVAAGSVYQCMNH